MKILKTLGTLLVGVGLVGNSFAQDTVRTAEGYQVYNDKDQLVEQIKKSSLSKVTINREYDKEKLIKEKEHWQFEIGGEWKNNIIISLFEYNDKSELKRETISYYKEGESRPEMIETYLFKGKKEPWIILYDRDGDGKINDFKEF